MSKNGSKVYQRETGYDRTAKNGTTRCAYVGLTPDGTRDWNEYHYGRETTKVYPVY